MRLEMIASGLGEPTAREHGQRAHDLLAELGDDRNLGNVLLNLGVTAKDTDDWHGAVERYLASADAYARAGDAVGRAFALDNLAEIRLDQGQLDRAERDVLEARRIFRANGQDLGVAATMSSLGTIAARRGRYDEARTWLTATRRRWRTWPPTHSPTERRSSGCCAAMRSPPCVRASATTSGRSDGGRNAIGLPISSRSRRSDGRDVSAGCELLCLLSGFVRANGEAHCRDNHIDHSVLAKFV